MIILDDIFNTGFQLLRKMPKNVTYILNDPGLGFSTKIRDLNT